MSKYKYVQQYIIGVIKSIINNNKLLNEYVLTSCLNLSIEIFLLLTNNIYKGWAKWLKIVLGSCCLNISHHN